MFMSFQLLSAVAGSLTLEEQQIKLRNPFATFVTNQSNACTLRYLFGQAAAALQAWRRKENGHTTIWFAAASLLLHDTISVSAKYSHSATSISDQQAAASLSFVA